MKFFVAFAAFVAVAVALPTKSAFINELELEAIIAAIHSPNTDPATAALLEEQLEAILNPGSPVVPEPISVGPELIDFPLSDGGAVTAPVAPIVPSPVVIGPIAPDQPTPLVQLIVNVNGAPFPIPTPIDGAVLPEPLPVIVVDEAENAPVIGDAPVVVEPVQVVDISPVVVEPVQIGIPVIPVPAVNIPETLN